MRHSGLACGLFIAFAVSGSALRAAEAADPEKGAAPAAEEGKPASVITAKLTTEKIKRRWRGRERTWTVMRLKVTNTGKETVVLPYPLEVKLTAKDAAGKAVPERENPRRRGEPEKKGDEKKKEEEKPKRDPKKAVRLAVFKPGQSFTLELRREIYMIAFPEKGKYKVKAVIEVEKEKEELLAGVTRWSGKVTSNEIEWEVTRVWNQQPRPAPKKDPKKDAAKAEEF